MNTAVPKEPQSDAIVFTTGVEAAEKFRKHATISDETIAKARERFEGQKGQFETGLKQDIHSAQQYFANYRHEPNVNTLSVIRRHVLGIKSSAGMVGKPVVTEIASLLFELFDDGYDLKNEKVLDSISLYLRTLEDLLTGQMNLSSTQEVQTLLDQFTHLNAQIR